MALSKATPSQQKLDKLSHWIRASESTAKFSKQIYQFVNIWVYKDRFTLFLRENGSFMTFYAI